PGGVHERRHDGRIDRSDIAEDLAVRPRDALEMCGIRDEHAGPSDVREARSRTPERLTDDLETEARLLVRVLGRSGAVRRDWRRPRDVDVLTHDDGTAVAHDRLVGRVSRDRTAR